MTTSPAGKRRSVYADRLLEFPDFVFSDGTQFQRRAGWHDHFRRRIGSNFDGRIIFEIGCFDATLLTKVAPTFPTTAFIGLDWKCRALHTGAMHVAAAGLRNVALLHGRAQDMCQMFSEGELHEAWLFHPDPCDKPKELPNRLVSEGFLLDVNRVLQDGGKFVMKTDHRGYYQSVLETLHVQTVIERFEMSGNSADFWNDDDARRETADRAFAGEVTGFESRFIKRRLPIYFVELTKGLPSRLRPESAGFT